MAKITTLHIFSDGSKLLFGEFFLFKRRQNHPELSESCGVFHVSKHGRILNKFSQMMPDGLVLKLFKISRDNGVVLIFANMHDCVEYHLDSQGSVLQINNYKIVQQDFVADTRVDSPSV